MQLDRLSVGVVGIAPRLEDLAQDPLLPRLGQDLTLGEVVAAEGDPDADLVAGDDELGHHLPRPVKRVVEVAALEEDAAIGSFGLDPLVIRLAVFPGGCQLHIPVEVEPGAADQDRLLPGADLDLAGVVQEDDRPQDEADQAEGGQGPGRTAVSRRRRARPPPPRPTGAVVPLLDRIHRAIPWCFL